MTPRVSTIIPAYNAGRWIEAAVRSALDQGVEQEVIVIDDGSTDDTAKLAAGLGEQVRVVSQPNSGVSSARNRGLEAARAEFIAFLDADDVWLPGKLLKQLAVFDQFPQAGTVICDEVQVADDGTVVHESFLATRSFYDRLPVSPGLIDKPLTWLVTDSFFPTSGVLTKRYIAAEAGSFDTNLTIVEDRDFWIRLALRAPVAIVPEVLLRYRTGGNGSLSTLYWGRWARSLKTVLDKHRDELLRRLPQEDTDARATLGQQYLLAAHHCWYADQFEDARVLFLDAARLGAVDLPKLIASQLGIVSFARALRRLVA
jgi:glycosyltransferase involved in cell wall biosynthesis